MCTNKNRKSASLDHITTLVIALLLLACGVKCTNSDSHIQALLEPLALTNKASIDYTTAVARFQHPDRQTLQLIKVEIKSIGDLERKQNYLEAANRTLSLRKAFEIAGTNLAPLLPDFGSEFLSGDSVGASGWALVTIGGDAWLTLLQGLTNTNLRVQLCAVEAMPYANGTNAALALPFLESFLTNKSDILRIQSVDAIGQLAVDVKGKTNSLLHTMEVDTNITVRCMAIKALGRLGNSENVIAILQQASKDKNASVRYAATTMLKEIFDRKNQ
jgi:hypothetical protein